MPTPAPVAREQTEDLPYKWLILVGLITAAILEVLDTTIVNVAMPQMAGNLGATAEEIGWVSTGYILSNVVVLPMTAWLSGRFGRKRYLTGSILLFLLASFFCGTSHTLLQLVFWRIIQGSGGAALLSTAQSTLREIFPKEQQGTVQGIYMLGIIVAPTIGPTVGGWITDNWSWPWVFFVNLPIGLVAAALVYTFLADSPFQKRVTNVDWGGIALLAVGLGSLQYVLEEGNQDDWFESATITRLAILAVVCIVSLIAWELSPRNRHPVVNFRVLRHWNLSGSLILFIALGFGLYGGVFLFPLFVQDVLGFTATITGLVMLPGGIATGVSAILCGRLLNGRKQLIHPRYLIIFGMTMFVTAMWSLGHLTTMSGEPDTRTALIIRGLGLGFLFLPITLAAFSQLKGAEIAQGAALMNLMRQLGGSFGIAVLGTYLTNRTQVHQTFLGSNIYSGNAMYEQRLRMLTGGLVSRGYDLASAKAAALHLIAGTVQVQATTQAFNDAFQLVAIVVVLVSPLVFLLRGSGSAPAGADMGH